MTNQNLVRNGGFEQSTPPALPPFWSGSGETQSGGTQLLGDNHARLLVGETITQTLLPLQAGEQYQFQASFAAAGGLGTIDVDITGIPTQKFLAGTVPSTYTFLNFDFIAAGTTASLTITNNSNADLRVDVVSVKKTNSNLVQNGGFEQSTPPALSPFWSGSGETQSGSSQLLGDNNALLLAGETIIQTLLPLQIGERYQFQAALATTASTGTLDVDITGISTRKFQANNVTGLYSFYHFDFIATSTTASLIITNNSDAGLLVDVVSVKRANPKLLQNGGFEQSDESASDELAPFWIGTGSINTGGSQLLGINNGDIDEDEFIAQALLPLQVGETYEFKAAIVFDSAPTFGTIDVDITGITTRRFQAVNIRSGNQYVFYSFTFVANEANAALAISNNSDGSINIDSISIKLA